MRSGKSHRKRTLPESLSIRVCLALAVERGVHPWKSPPLYESIDPSALDALGAQQSRRWRFEFTADGHVVTVTGDDDIEVDGDLVTERELQDAFDAMDRPESVRRLVE